ncbi:TetR/AcrR family transcriptional regulator [Kocuria rhizophila]|uniref:TetR/AcrR family transcriptional regulator n=1 Tax=Kocuria rhizophila TaxID=72000 RepID=UPI00217CEC54|nr:TetR/AcrR family transcriptional regulator [Kocuria rhizophila]
MTPQLISGCRERPEAEPKDKREAIRLRNRRAIVAAAGELTAELGTEGVSVNGLAERAGVSRRTIFNHFPSAQDAAFEYLSELVTELIDTVLDDLPEPTEPGTASLGEVYRQLIGALRARVLIGDLQPVFSVDVQETQAASLWGYRVTRTAVERLNEVLRERLPHYTRSRRTSWPPPSSTRSPSAWTSGWSAPAGARTSGGVRPGTSCCPPPWRCWGGASTPDAAASSPARDHPAPGNHRSGREPP